MLCLLVSTTHPFMSISSTMKCACVQSRCLSIGCQSKRTLRKQVFSLHTALRNSRAALQAARTHAESTHMSRP